MIHDMAQLSLKFKMHEAKSFDSIRVMLTSNSGASWGTKKEWHGILGISRGKKKTFAGHIYIVDTILQKCFSPLYISIHHIYIYHNIIYIYICTIMHNMHCCFNNLLRICDCRPSPKTKVMLIFLKIVSKMDFRN